MKLLIVFTGICLLASFIASRKQTIAGLKKGAMMFLKIFPTILSVTIIVSIVFYLVPEQKIALWFGDKSGIWGSISAALIGSISLIQGFIAYPMAGFLVQSGVGYPVIAIFITCLMMVGILTIPVEARYFGWKFAILRNTLSFIFALIVGLLIGVVWNIL